MPVLKIGDGESGSAELVRESSECVARIAALDCGSGASLAPEDDALAAKMIALGNGLLADAGKAVVLSGQTRSRQLDACLRELDAQLRQTACLAGARFSTADAVLLPFLWRIRDSLELPSDLAALRECVDRQCAQPYFAKTVVQSWWWWWWW